MPVINCNNCGQSLTFPDQHRGGQIRCPQCSTVQAAIDKQEPYQAEVVGGGNLYTAASVQPQFGRQTSDRGVVVLVLGILSIVFCPIFGPFAWVMGSGDLKKMDLGQMSTDGRSMTQAGMIMGMVMSIFMIIGFAFLLFWLVMLVGIAAI